MKTTIAFALCAALIALPAAADKAKKGTSPGQAKQGGAQPGAKGAGVPPGLAKKGGLPPGIAKKFGARPPAVAYIAIDPRYHDRAWFLIDGRWTLKKGFDDPLRLEIGAALKLPPVPPPIPLPKLNLPDPLHVVSFR
ncbi:MAG: hypothetical protein NDJ92_10480 [Thermoanaerobaculia bacterium]|nr:hypothetical protein [Thermoanaerobaculia bacterium]